jgi:hypothetical protein
MAKTSYRDLAEFGLPLVTPESATFAALVRDIEARPQPFESWPASDLDTAAVLVNQSGKAIVTVDFVWRYKTAQGQKSCGHWLNSGGRRAAWAVTAIRRRHCQCLRIPQSTD